MKQFNRLLAVVLALSLLSGLLLGCTIVTGFEYANADKYQIGSAEFSDPVTAIEIDWLSGHVKVETWSGDTVRMEEGSSKVLDADMSVHYWLDGTTLRIKYAKSGFISDLFQGTKTLTLYLPENAQPDALSIDVASADITLEHICVSDLEIDTASGPVSGSVDRAGTIDVDTASGKINLNVGSADRFEADSASGTIDLTCTEALPHVSIESASGDIRVILRSQPENVSLENASGDIKLTLPQDCAFTAGVTTASGDFDCQFPAQRSGSVYTVGDGAASVSLSTASGDIDIEKGN